MKEGYFQNKIAEFSEKLQAFDHRLKMLDTEFDRYQKQLGEFKQLIKKLQNIENFQQNAIEQISKKNNSNINSIINNLTDSIEQKIDTVIHKQTHLMKKTVKTLEHDAEIFQQSLQEIDEFKQEIIFFQEFQRLLMLKLINKGILNHRELQEIELRAKKRTKQ